MNELEDLESCVCRGNLRIRGILELVVDIQSKVTAMLQELQPTIPVE